MKFFFQSIIVFNVHSMLRDIEFGIGLSLHILSATNYPKGAMLEKKGCPSLRLLFSSSPGEATGLAGGTGGATGWFTDEPVSSVSQEDSRSISISRVSSFQVAPESPAGAIILVKPSPVSSACKAKPTVKASPAEQEQPNLNNAKDRVRPPRKKLILQRNA